VDYRKVAAQLRIKAADAAVSEAEAATLRAKATELEAKYGSATPPTPPRPRTHAPAYYPPFRPTWVVKVTEAWADIVEEGFQHDDDEVTWSDY